MSFEIHLRSFYLVGFIGWLINDIHKEKRAEILFISALF